MMFIDLHGRETFAASDTTASAPKLLTVIATRNDDELPESTPPVGDPASLLGVAEVIRSHIEGRYHLDGREIEIGASIGIAPAPQVGIHRDALLLSADHGAVND
jgi:predicted signal transduction protein with EAL and GGDEF domain